MSLIRRIIPLLMVVGLLQPLAGAVPADAAVGEGTTEPAFTESWGCGQPSTGSTVVEHTGFLASSEALRGYRGDFFGRSIGEVRGSLVYWTVPMSGGYRILMHERLIPALNQVTANLAAEQAKGNYYAIKPSQTFGYNSRTISGSYRVSMHGHGAAIDINTLSNPYRGDNKLITNMPDWFVQAWRDAGFCWGGDWNFVKDAQHFSWMGPAATSSDSTTPISYRVRTAAAPFTDQVLSTSTPFGTPEPNLRYLIADGDGDRLADVFQLVPRANGTRLEYSQTDRRHSWCAVGRDHALDVFVGDRTALFGDYSRVGRNDLLLVDGSGENLTVEVSLKPTAFEESVVIPTAIPTDPGDEYLVADHDRDGFVDLYVIRRTADWTQVLVHSGADEFTTVLLQADTSLGETSGRFFTVGDIDVDGLPDLFVVTDLGESKLVEVLPNGYETVSATYVLDVGGKLIDVSVNDYDGDGRGDLWFWDDAGDLTVRLGNTRVPGVGLTSWHNTPGWTCPAELPPYDYEGLFRDDDDNVHQIDIDTIGEIGISVGCNPPFNDDYCPDRKVTRGEMAAFLVRALELADDSGMDWFNDDDESVFQSDINALAATGITAGCNPPDNDRFCPEVVISRAQMAAFLVRGLELSDPGEGDLFIDDDQSIFQTEINILATAGITLGCNPPANDRFCPYESVRRDQMASFLARSVALLTSR